MIKGLSEIRRLPRGGKIRLGIKKKTAQGKEYPSEIDYFVLDPNTPDQKRRDALIAQFQKLYGDKPKAIKVMFPPVPREMFFAQFLKRYGKGALLKCKGDGEIAETIPEFAEGLEKIGETERGFIQVKCLGDECPYTKSGECGRMASLQVILPELSGISIWQIDTGSYNSIVNMNSAIDYIQALTGRYAMLPLTLLRKPVDVAYEGKKSKHYVLDIDLEHVSIGELQKFAMLTPVERALIPAPDESKDELFYDANGKRPELPAPEEEEPAEFRSSLLPNGPIKEEPLLEPKEPEKPKGKATGPIADRFNLEVKSMARMRELFEAITALKNRKAVNDYCKTLKEGGHLDTLISEHKDELREKVVAYLKELKA